MGEPTINYGCTKLRYDDYNARDGDPATHAWESADGGYFADVAYEEIIISKKDGKGNKLLATFPANVSSFSDVYVDVFDTNPKSRVHLFRNGQEIGTKRFLGDFIDSCSSAARTSEEMFSSPKNSELLHRLNDEGGDPRKIKIMAEGGWFRNENSALVALQEALIGVLKEKIRILDPKGADDFFDAINDLPRDEQLEQMDLVIEMFK